METEKKGFFTVATSVSLKDIAEMCDVDVKTVRRWIDKMSTGDGQNVQGIDEIKIKCYEAGERGEAVKLTLKEAMSIISVGRGDAFAGSLKVNAAQAELDRQKAEKPALTASFIRALTASAKAGVISPKQAQLLMGLPPSSDDGRRLMITEKQKARYVPIYDISFDKGVEKLEALNYPVDGGELGDVFKVARTTIWRHASALGLNTARGRYSLPEAVTIWRSMVYGDNVPE